jgi:hypothetical protein
MKKIFLFLVLIPLLSKSQHINLLNVQPKNSGMLISNLSENNDSIIFTGVQFEKDSITSTFLKNFYIGKMSNKNSQNYAIYPIFKGTNNFEIYPIKIFKKQFGYSVLGQYFKTNGYYERECGITLINLTDNFTVIDTADILIETITAKDTLTPNIYKRFNFESEINSSNNYVITIVKDDSSFFKQSTPIEYAENIILEINENGKIFNKKKIDWADNLIPSRTNELIAPISSIQEINLNDSIKYIGFFGNRKGGYAFLDSNFNIKQVINYIGLDYSKPLEFRYFTYVTKSLKMGQNIIVAGHGDSVSADLNSLLTPMFIIKKYSNGIPVKSVCLDAKIDYNIENFQLEYFKYNHQISTNNQKQILVTTTAFSKTYIALLDSNLNMIWQKFLNADMGNGGFGTGLIGATASKNMNGYYFYGSTCLTCNIESDKDALTGFIGYINEKGFLLNTKEDIIIKNSVNIYPNPSTDNIFNFEMNNGKMETLSVYTLTGKQVFQTDFTKPASNFRLNLTDWANGIYFYKISTTSNQNITGKLIKQ